MGPWSAVVGRAEVPVAVGVDAVEEGLQGGLVVEQRARDVLDQRLDVGVVALGGRCGGLGERHAADRHNTQADK